MVSTLASSFQAFCFVLALILLPGVLEIHELRQSNQSVNLCSVVHRNVIFPSRFSVNLRVYMTSAGRDL